MGKINDFPQFLHIPSKKGLFESLVLAEGHPFQPNHFEAVKSEFRCNLAFDAVNAFSAEGMPAEEVGKMHGIEKMAVAIQPGAERHQPAVDRADFLAAYIISQNMYHFAQMPVKLSLDNIVAVGAVVCQQIERRAQRKAEQLYFVKSLVVGGGRGRETRSAVRSQPQPDGLFGLSRISLFLS